MTLVALLVSLGGIVGMAAVEIATAHDSATRIAAWRLCAGTPVLVALALMWTSYGAAVWPLVLFVVAQPMLVRRWLVKERALGTATSSVR